MRDVPGPRDRLPRECARSRAATNTVSLNFPVPPELAAIAAELRGRHILDVEVFSDGETDVLLLALDTWPRPRPLFRYFAFVAPFSIVAGFVRVPIG